MIMFLPRLGSPLKDGCSLRAHQLRECRDGRPGLPVPKGPYGPCGRKATLNLNFTMQCAA